MKEDATSSCCSTQFDKGAGAEVVDATRSAQTGIFLGTSVDPFLRQPHEKWTNSDVQVHLFQEGEASTARKGNGS